MNISAAPTIVIDTVVGRRGAPVIDFVIVAALAAYVVLFLVVRGATNACFFVLVLLALWHLLRQRAAFAEAWHIPGSPQLFAALASVFAGAFIAKVLRDDVNHIDLNSPARFLLAGLLLLYLTVKRVRLVRLFAVALPLSTLCALAAIMFNPQVIAKWDGRFATSAVDPNTLGSYAVILTFMILMTVDALDKGSPWRRGLASAGIVAGLLLAAFAGSRSGWLAAPPLAALWLLIRRQRGLPRLVWQMLAILGAVALIAVVVPDIAVRGLRSVSEVRSWLDGSNPVTAAGQRLDVWKLGLRLYAASPLLGYGWAGVPAALARPEFAAASPEIVHILKYGGPHNDLLTMALNSGVFGIAAFAALLFVPAAFFWRQRKVGSDEARLACDLGMCLITGVFICGLSNEMLSLKYLVSFYGLTVAGLAAQVLGDGQAAGDPPSPLAAAHP